MTTIKLSFYTFIIILTILLIYSFIIYVNSSPSTSSSTIIEQSTPELDKVRAKLKDSKVIVIN